METSPRNVRRHPFAVLLIVAVLLSGMPVALAQGSEEAAEQSSASATSRSPGQDDPILIRLGNRVERLSDVEWRFEVAMRSFASGQGVPYTEELAAQLRGLMPNYLEQRGTELVLLREAEVRGFTPNEESVQNILAGLRTSVPEDQYESRLAEAGFPAEANLVRIIREGDLITQVLEALRTESAPTDEEIRVRYLADQSRYTQPETYCARHILVEEEELATELVERVRSGEDFATLAGEYGTDGTAANGGDLGCFQRGMMVAAFEDAVVAATLGEVAGPIETQFGYHALLVYDHRPQQVRTFEEVREEVEASVTADAASAALDGLIRGSGLVTYPERLETP